MGPFTIMGAFCMFIEANQSQTNPASSSSSSSGKLNQESNAENKENPHIPSFFPKFPDKRLIKSTHVLFDFFSYFCFLSDFLTCSSSLCELVQVTARHVQDPRKIKELQSKQQRQVSFILVENILEFFLILVFVLL